MIRHPYLCIVALTLFCVAPLPRIVPMVPGSIAMAGCQHHRSCTDCPRCYGCCTLEVKKKDEEKHCWKVEAKEICVPRVVFPWQNWKGRHSKGHQVGCTDGEACTKGGCSGGGCTNCVKHNGAWVKTVRVLKKHTYTCPTCSYSWSPRKPACSGPSCSEDGSDDQSVAD